MDARAVVLDKTFPNVQPMTAEKFAELCHDAKQVISI